MPPSYDSQFIFGRSVSISHEIEPPAQQLSEFFGVSGQLSLWGGLRGRVFLVTGVLTGVDAASLNANEALFASYVGDGIARVLVDARGRSWPYVLCMPPFQPAQRVMQDLRGFYLSYKATFKGVR